ncbi:hypothetical protein VTN00DRAFT_9320 [Thermoascus crustaceus]|uniref:uncharacterized protein n=1 Tax=Thermoascus crustaceus TaxID=5088 RepID=UPI0037445545
MVTAAGTDASPVSGTPGWKAQRQASCCIRPAAPASPDSRLPCFGARQGGAPVPAPLGDFPEPSCSSSSTSYGHLTFSPTDTSCPLDPPADRSSASL